MPESDDRSAAHQRAHADWQRAEAAYWELLEELQNGVPIAESNRQDIVEHLSRSHAAWMSAARALVCEAGRLGAERGIAGAPPGP